MLEIVTPLVLAYLSGRLYSWLGGDEKIAERHPYLKRSLQLIHHWQFVAGSFLIALLFEIGLDFGYPRLLLGFLWLGVGLFLEDFTYHIAHAGWWGEPAEKAAQS